MYEQTRLQRLTVNVPVDRFFQNPFWDFWNIQQQAQKGEESTKQANIRAFLSP